MQYYTHTCKCGCGGKIEIKKYHKRRGVPLYIHGHNARGKSHPFYGKHHTEESLSKIREKRKLQPTPMKGRKLTEDHMRKIKEAKKGFHHSKETREILSIKNKGRNHPQWLGGISFEEYGIEFNKELKIYIKNRDLNVCQTPNCMNIENLCIHHIDSNKKNNNPENLITLCNSCHSKTNFNRPYWVEYYKEISGIYL